MAVQNDFSKGSILSHMARIALPMTLAQFVNILYNIIDRVFIGRIPDHATEALTGLGVAFPICTLAIAFANLVGMGGAPLFSIERGKGNEEEAKYILGNSFNLLVVIGVVFSVDLLMRNTFCDVKPWYECIYQCAGLCQYRNDDGIDRCSLQPDFGSNFYF